MPEVRAVAKTFGRDQALSLALWRTAIYEARLLAAFVGVPAEVTRRQMARWVLDFDSWALCDAVCMHLFDRTDHVWSSAEPWMNAQPTYQRRAGFALVWGAAVHRKDVADEGFFAFENALVEGARDERPHVYKAVDMCVRAIGRRSAEAHAFALRVAQRLEVGSPAQRRVAGRIRRKLRAPLR